MLVPEHMTPVIKVVNIFVGDSVDNTFLVVRRAESDTQYPGMLALPGGQIKPVESLEAAAIRKAKEETGYDINLLSPQIVLHSVIPFHELTLDISVVEAELVANPTFQIDTDIEIITWVTPDEFITSLLKHEYPLTEVKKFERFLRSKGYVLV